MHKRNKTATVVGLIVLLLISPDAFAQGQYPGQLAGPSFPCPVPRDPLAQLICDAPTLSRFDLVFVQTYQALRQQAADPASQQSLRQEALDFGRAARTMCGIATAQSANSKAPPPPSAPPGASSCVLQAYQQQRAVWLNRLSGPASEEALRPPEQQVMLQMALQRLKYLAPADTFDGVFGPVTRAAITDWQQAKGRETSGLLGNGDARDITREAANYVESSDDRQKVAALEEQNRIASEQNRIMSEREKRRRDLVAKYGDHAQAILAGEAQVGMNAEEVTEARGWPGKRDQIPPNFEVWIYERYRVAFTDGKVTHVGQ
jgi:Putative peptidoglycan binding domain